MLIVLNLIVNLFNPSLTYNNKDPNGVFIKKQSFNE